MRRWGIIAACLSIAACTTTQVKLADSIERPAPTSRMLVLQPDVQLSIITAGGLLEARADWSTQARDNIAAAVRSALDGKGLKYSALDPSSVESGRNAQLLRLNNAVGQSILIYNYGLVLPTHKAAFNWTLGDGVKSLGDTYGGDYALFINARGSYSSDTRKAVMVIATLVGVSIPTGGQSLVASLVDLKTGRIVWFNVAQASPDADMRSPEGAQKLLAEVLKSAPF